jgi:hypothetical protein
MKPFLFLILFFFIFSLSCDRNDPGEINSIQWNITKVEGASSSTINENISLKAYYQTASGCDIFDRFEQTGQDRVISIKAYGHTADMICTAQAVERSSFFYFVPTMSGTYEFRFINRDNTVISHTVTIN